MNQKVGTIIGGTAASLQGSTTVGAGASLTTYQIVQNSLTIHGTGTTIATSGSVTLVPSGSGSTANPTGPNNVNFCSTITSLSIDNNGAARGSRAYFGTLDIGNNGLVVEYGTAANDPYASIDDMIRSGFDSAHWDGTGITSSLARAAENSHTPLNIGLLDFTPGLHGDGTFFVFQGQTITTNAILVGLTYMDDINLFGDMNIQHAASDALLFAANYGTGIDLERRRSDPRRAQIEFLGRRPALRRQLRHRPAVSLRHDRRRGNPRRQHGGGPRAIEQMALSVLGAMGLALLARCRHRE